MAVDVPTARRRPRTLVLRALGLGDLLTAVPALRALRRGLPNHEILLAAPSTLSGLAFATGAVDSVIDTTTLGPVPWSGPPPDVAVNLHGRGPRSHRRLLDLRPWRVMAFANDSVKDVEGPSWCDDEHEVVRWCRLLRAYGFQADPHDLAMPVPAPTVGPTASLMPHLPPHAYAIVHPGASTVAKQWPPDRFAAVARRLAQQGLPVVVTGSARERTLAERVASAAGLQPEAVRAGETSAMELAALVAYARVVICGDTGVGHLATAYGTPSVLLFGPVSPQHWGPPPTAAQHLVLWRGTGGRSYGDRPDPALLAISVDEVIDAVETVLDRVQAGLGTGMEAVTVSRTLDRAGDPADSGLDLRVGPQLVLPS